MPHQCIKCGEVYAEGTSDILRGCPKCGGTRFFFTRKPLEGDDLSDMQAKSKDELQEMIQNMFVKNKDLLPDSGIDDDSNDPETVKKAASKHIPKQVSRQLLKQAQKQVQKQVEKRALSDRDIQVFDDSSEDHDALIQHILEAPAEDVRELRDEEIEALKLEAEKASPSVEVVSVVEQGTYEINIKRLMDNSPIVVQNNGIYMIHLHSAFSALKKEEK